MHAYCLISETGRSRARAPQEMDHPPALKTRRSNAVHSRRLALHVSLLERHMAAMETERARAVRRLQEELSQLRVPARTLNVSPGHARIVCDADHRVVTTTTTTATERREELTLPGLTLSERKASPSGRAEESYQVRQPPATVCEGLPRIPNSTALLENQLDAGHPESNKDEHKEHGPSKSPPVIPSSNSRDSYPTAESSARMKPSSGSGTNNYPRNTSGGGTGVSYTVGLPFKRGSNQRAHRSLPRLRPSHGLRPGHAQGRGQGQGHRDHGQRLCRREPGGQAEATEECGQASQTAQKSQESEVHNFSAAVDAATPGQAVRQVKQSQEPEVRDLSAAVDAATPGQPERPAPATAKATDRDSELVPSSGPAEQQGGAQSSSVAVASSLPSVIQRASPPSSRRSRKQAARATRALQRLCPLAGAPHHHHECSYFPCVQPHTYHSLGFHPDPSTHSWRGWIVQNACRPHHRLVPGRQPPAHLPDGRRTPADAPGYVKRKRLGREDVVRLDMARKKQEHALARPPSWNTNYGQPTPFRRLKCPVRLKPLT